MKDKKKVISINKKKLVRDKVAVLGQEQIKRVVLPFLRSASFLPGGIYGKDINYFLYVFLLKFCKYK